MISQSMLNVYCSMNYTSPKKALQVKKYYSLVGTILAYLHLLHHYHIKVCSRKWESTSLSAVLPLLGH